MDLFKGYPGGERPDIKDDIQGYDIRGMEEGLPGQMVLFHPEFTGGNAEERVFYQINTGGVKYCRES
jgi:hypothetical protein